MNVRRALFASLIGTTIEFYDFYIYGTAAVLVFPQLFFPTGDMTTARLQSFATFALAFLARPVGSALFGHFGDRIGRKATLVAALLTMGLSTVAIGLLPTYASIGLAAPALLALCRLGQGIGLGGEWGGAVLLATENAPPGKEARYSMFPQLGAPLGLLLSSGSFIALAALLPEADFIRWGWRVPFLASATLVIVGLYVRLQITETLAFQRAAERRERVRVPIASVVRDHPYVLVLATLLCVTTFVVSYLMTVFTLSWGTSQLGFSREQFLLMQMIGVVFFGVTIVVSTLLAERYGALAMLIASSIAAIAVGLLLEPLFSTSDVFRAALFLVVGFALNGFTYGPLGAAMTNLFPTAVRYTGASMTYSVAGIIGGSLAPYLATYLAASFGIAYVGYYLCAAAAVTLIAQLLIVRRTRRTSN
ncbi:MAG: MFS transporter [Gammaproteobacteria bacterium]